MGFAHSWFRMILGCYWSDSHDLFWVFEDFWKKIAKEQTGKFGHIGLLCLSVRNPRCDVDLRCSVGCLVAARPRGQNGTPKVRHGVGYDTPSWSNPIGGSEPDPRCFVFYNL